jgi:hypothetical protein
MQTYLAKLNIFNILKEIMLKASLIIAGALSLAGCMNDSVATSAKPITAEEREPLNRIPRCWSVDPNLVGATSVMTLQFKLDRNGFVQGWPRLISYRGDSSGVDAAYLAASRAILRCQSGGYKLPADKYDQWKEIEITFDWKEAEITFDRSGIRLR